MHRISPATIEAAAAAHVRTLLRTDQSGWTSALVHDCESPPRFDEPFETQATPDPVVRLLVSASGRFFIQKSGGWSPHDLRRGGLCFTRASETHRLRWQGRSGEAIRMIHFYIPGSTMSAVREEMEAPRGHWSEGPGIFFDDATTSHLLMAAARAARQGASDVYAQSAATLVAYQLQSGGFAPERRTYPMISDRRLLRVLDFIEANYDRPLSLKLLAAEAGISQYHFAVLFRRAVGRTPHRHVQEVRLRCATAMLRSTDRSVLDIAFSCGFSTPAHFSAAFRTAYGESPTAYRARHRRGD
jgi:AraC family transcriptional regulator